MLGGEAFPAAQRQHLINQQEGCSVAKVELVINNEEGRLYVPGLDGGGRGPGRSGAGATVRICRHVTLKSDKIVLDGDRHLTLKELEQMWGSSGVPSGSRSFMYIRQNEVTLLATVDPAARLKVLQDMAGDVEHLVTRTYSASVLGQRAADNLNQAKETLRTVENCIEDLQGANEEYLAWAGLEKWERSLMLVLLDHEHAAVSGLIEDLRRKMSGDSAADQLRRSKAEAAASLRTRLALVRENLDDLCNRQQAQAGAR